jgi:hypothetical protein
VERIAAQWIALGCQLTGNADTAIVDIEALIAITAELGDHDPRVYEAALGWCVGYGNAVNTARLKNVAAEMEVRSDGLAEFAGTVAAAGGPRWPLAAGGRPYEPRSKMLVVDLAPPARLAWRVRAAFGVSARADIIAALLAMPAPAISVAELAHLTRFTKRNIAQAATGMRLAGVVEIDRAGNEDRVRLAPAAPLRGWLYPRPIGPFIDWPARWRVALVTLRLLGETADSTPAVRTVEARASIDALRPLLNDAGLPVPNTTPVGSAFASAYDAWAEAVEQALRTPGR